MHLDQNDMPNPAGGSDRVCARRHLPSLHLTRVVAHLNGVKDVVAKRPATFGATGTSGYTLSGHVHGQNMWALVVLTGLGLAAETIQKVVATRRQN
jgi:hypothetical protein